MRAIIIDDEKSAQNTLLELLEKYFPNLVRVCDVCDSGAEGIAKIKELRPEVVFLDVNMPNMTGFDMLKALGFPDIDFKVIFCSSHGENAIKAFRFSASDFLVKPVKLEELIEAVTRVKESIIRNYQALEIEKYRVLLDNMNKVSVDTADSKKIVLSTLEGVYFIDSDDIIRLEADGNYTTFYTSTHKPIIVARRIGEFDELYPFYRVHRSWIINPRHVTRVTRGDSIILHFSDDSQVEVSRSKKDEVINFLRDYMTL